MHFFQLYQIYQKYINQEDLVAAELKVSYYN
jgi:hypothetical protein